MGLGQRWVVNRIAGATAVTIPRASHWLANEQDALLAACIADFVATLDQSGSR